MSETEQSFYDEAAGSNEESVTVRYIILALALLTASLSSCGGDAGDMAMGWVVCKSAVRAGLKAPSTAKFDGIGVSKGSIQGGSYSVSSWVDSQNGFGATVRSDFYCRVSLVDREVESLVFL